MGLFSKKPGGTFFGNLLRGVGSTIAPGILGTGKNMIPPTVVSPVPTSQPNLGQGTPVPDGQKGFIDGLLGVISGQQSIKVDVGMQTPQELPKWLPIVGLGVLGYFLVKPKTSRRY